MMVKKMNKRKIERILNKLERADNLNDKVKSLLLELHGDVANLRE